MSRRIVYMPGSGVEPGRDGYKDFERGRRDRMPEYPTSRAPRRERNYEREGWEVRPIGFERYPYARRSGMVGMTGSERYSGGNYESGNADYVGEDSLTWEEAKRWAKKMRNADGSTGAHWSIDQTNIAMHKNNIECDECEFWITMNMLYSDYCAVAEKYGVAVIDFFACMAKAFLEDEDAVDDKLTAYYDYIVEH